MSTDFEVAAAIDAARLAPDDEWTAQVKVRFKGERRFVFLASGGRTTRLHFHAANFPSRALAVAVADEQLHHGAEHDVVAVAVMQHDRRVYFAGEATPDRDAATIGPEAGHRWLVRVTGKRHPVFEARNDDGSWGHFSMEDYGDAMVEAREAGLDTSLATVYARTCGIATRGLLVKQVTA